MKVSFDTVTDIVKCWKTTSNPNTLIVIPKSIINKLDIKSGDRFLITHDGNDVIVLKRFRLP